MKDSTFWVLVVAMLIIVGGSAVWTITEANKCADKGGVYITGKSVWPVCLKAETLW